MIPLIELQDVSVVRDGRSILKELSLSIFEGGHTAILGPNGCGKSTLIKLLSREIHAHAGRGTYRVLGRQRWTQAELRTVLGVVSAEPKEPLLGDPTGLDVAISGLLGTYGVLVQRKITPEMVDRGRAALARVDAQRLADQPIATMSAGEERRCWIARALAPQPRALILDEPTSGLDFVSRRRFMDTVQVIAENTTIVLVTHHLEEVLPEFGRVLLMKDGEIFAQGSRDEIFRREKIAQAFDAEPAWVPLAV